jgi:hypothetical protein
MRNCRRIAVSEAKLDTGTPSHVQCLHTHTFRIGEAQSTAGRGLGGLRHTPIIAHLRVNPLESYRDTYRAGSGGGALYAHLPGAMMAAMYLAELVTDSLVGSTPVPGNAKSAAAAPGEGRRRRLLFPCRGILWRGQATRKSSKPRGPHVGPPIVIVRKPGADDFPVASRNQREPPSSAGAWIIVLPEPSDMWRWW